MLDVMKSRRGLVASAALVILLIGGFLFATAPSWRSLMTQSSDPKASAPAPISASLPASGSGETGSGPHPGVAGANPQPGTTPPGGQQAKLDESAPTSPEKQAGPPAGPSSGSVATDGSSGPVPSFDIVRVEPSGDSVIAARGAPNADVVLLDGDVPIARAKTDANGQVALLPPPLKPGEHSLTLAITSGPGGKTVSSQSVAVSMPDQPKTAPLVALLQPDKPAAILSGPVAGSAPTADSTPAAGGGQNPAHVTAVPAPAPSAVVIRSVEVESQGSFYASGKAPPGSASRVYLNGAFVATVTADSNGNWSLKINKGMKPGRYAVRVDQADGGGKVIARAEVPFDYPVQVAGANLRAEPAKKNTATQSAGPTGPVIVGAAGRPGQNGSAPVVGGADPTRMAPALPAGQPGGSTQTGRSEGAVDKATGAPAVASRNTDPSPSQAVSSGSSPGTATAGSKSTPMAPTKTDAGSPAPTAELARPLGDLRKRLAPAGEQKPELAPGQPGPQMPTAVATTASGQGSQPTSALSGRKPGASGAGAEIASNGTQPVPSGDKSSDEPVPTVVAELVTAKVIHGDSLWRISRQMLGHGVRYTQIYAANTQQIRDPKLIYPGQVFVLPQQ